MPVVVIEITCRGEPRRCRDFLPRNVQDGEAHILEAWPGSVTAQQPERPGAGGAISGVVLDVVGDFPEGASGFLLRVSPEEAREHLARQAACAVDERDGQEE